MLPTPTPYPAGIPMVTLNPADYTLWSHTDDAITAWNYFPATGPVIQWAVIIVIIVAFVVILYNLIQSVMNEDK